MANLVINNRMTASELMRSEGANLDVVKNPNTGKLFFTCGSKRGYISHKVAENLNSLSASDIQYGEIQAVINGAQTVVPTLFMASTANVVKSFKL